MARLLLGLSVAAVWAEQPEEKPTRREPTVLARVEVNGDVRDYRLNAHAFLQDASSQEYLLVFATESELRRNRWPYRILESPAAPPEDYLLAMRPGTAFAGLSALPSLVLLDDGVTLTLHATTTEAEQLAERGFALQRLARDPISWPASTRLIRHNQAPPEPQQRHLPFIEAMLSQVQSNQLYWLMRRFTGEEVVHADGQPNYINTRHTTSGAPIARALQFAFERLQPLLGSNVTFQGWSRSGYTNRNLIVSQRGDIRSNEWILITAHLDNMPSGARAPGADDDASGTLGVLTAASVFSQYRFDRSIRFMCFTGEEQGLYGSEVQAGLAFTNGDNIVGVFNADMIGWDGVGAPVFRLFTRSVSNPGFSNDLALAIAVTNVIYEYGLNDLAPVISATGLTASDHASFWNRGFPAVLLSEDYPSDFNPYYHTANDSMARLNWRYYVAAVHAFVGSVAHMAEPLEQIPLDVMRLTAGSWQTNAGVGGGAFHAKILPEADSGFDALDVTWPGSPAPPLAAWLKPFTAVAGTSLQTDARPDAAEVRFVAELTVVTTNGSTLSASNRLQFDFLAPPRADRIYLAKVATEPAYTIPVPAFLCVTNLRDLVAASGQIVLPNLNTAPNDAPYGRFDLVVRELNTDRSACQMRLVSATNTVVTLETSLQVGAAIVDQIETTSILDGSPWQPVGNFTNAIKPTLDNFDVGWQNVLYDINIQSLPATDQRYFRLRRTWQPQ